MKVAGLISIFSFLAFKSIYAQSCIINYKSAIYRIETNATTINIKTLQSNSLYTNHTINNNTNITPLPWKLESETQQGVTSLFSCITVHQYAFLLITPSITLTEDHSVKIITYNYESRLWRMIPLDLQFVMHPWTLLSIAWRLQYVVYNTERKVAYYFDTQHWSWYSFDDQHSYLAPPTPTKTTPEITVVSATLYYLYNEDADSHINHIYKFDLISGKWKGYFASFWSNTTSSFVFYSGLENVLYAIPRENNFNDRFMRSINLDSTPPRLIVQIPTIALPDQNTLVTSQSIVGSDGQDKVNGLIICNETTLVFYQPANNTITSVYDGTFTVPDAGSSSLPLPLPPLPPSFWSTPEGQRVKVVLGCSLSFGTVICTVVAMVLLQRRRRRRRQLLDQDDPLGPVEATDHQEESSHEETNNMKNSIPQKQAATILTRTTVSMQSLSFLTRDNAMVWGKNLHQLLALIAFHHKEKQSSGTLSRSSSDYPSMIKTSTTISALAKSSMILSIMSNSSNSISANTFSTPLHNTGPPTPPQRRSLDMTCPLPRDALGQGESSTPHL